MNKKILVAIIVIVAISIAGTVALYPISLARLPSSSRARLCGEISYKVELKF